MRPIVTTLLSIAVAAIIATPGFAIGEEVILQQITTPTSNSSRTPFNIQDQYLNQARKERVRVIVMMMSGEQLEGYIKSFDDFCLLIESNGDILLYKHAISSITSFDGNF